MTDIAVVIPCFNQGRVLGVALESVLGQSRPAAEVLVVDDGSTDLYTRALLASLRCSNTRIVRTVNRGPAAARNHGIRLTSAEYLVTLDADYRLDSDYLARTAARLDANPAISFVSTSMRFAGAPDPVWTPPDCNVVNALVRGMAHPAGVFRRQMWQAVGGFDESLTSQSCAGLDFWLSAIELGLVGDVIGEPLLEYRGRASSIYQTSVASGSQLQERETVVRKHYASIAAAGPHLLVEQERFLDERRAYQQELVQKRCALGGELRALEAEIDRMKQELARRGVPPLEWAEIGGLEPFSPVAARDRGLPIDLFYIRGFFRRHAADQHGDVLGIRDPQQSDDDVDGAWSATGGRADQRTSALAQIPGLPDESFDCLIVGDALRTAYDVRAALLELHRILRPGGVLLCALPAARGVSGTDRDRSDYWRFTEAAVRHLFAEVFPPEAFSVNGFGNVLVCAASLAGLAVDELPPTERDFVDPMFPLGYCVRAVKSSDRNLLTAGHVEGR